MDRYRIRFDVGFSNPNEGELMIFRVCLCTCVSGEKRFHSFVKLNHNFNVKLLNVTAFMCQAIHMMNPTKWRRRTWQFPVFTCIHIFRLIPLVRTELAISFVVQIWHIFGHHHSTPIKSEESRHTFHIILKQIAAYQLRCLGICLWPFARPPSALEKEKNTNCFAVEWNLKKQAVVCCILGMRSYPIRKVCVRARAHTTYASHLALPKNVSFEMQNNKCSCSFRCFVTGIRFQFPTNTTNASVSVTISSIICLQMKMAMPRHANNNVQHTRHKTPSIDEIIFTIPLFDNAKEDYGCGSGENEHDVIGFIDDSIALRGHNRIQSFVIIIISNENHLCFTHINSCIKSNIMERFNDVESRRAMAPVTLIIPNSNHAYTFGWLAWGGKKIAKMEFRFDVYLWHPLPLPTGWLPFPTNSAQNCLHKCSFAASNPVHIRMNNKTISLDLNWTEWMPGEAAINLWNFRPWKFHSKNLKNRQTHSHRSISGTGTSALVVYLVKWMHKNKRKRCDLESMCSTSLVFVVVIGGVVEGGSVDTRAHNTQRKLDSCELYLFFSLSEWHNHK